MPDGPACCDFNADRAHPYRTVPPHTYTDILGFTYRLCDRHYEALVAGLARARAARPHGAVFNRRRDRRAGPGRILAPEGQ